MWLIARQNEVGRSYYEHDSEWTTDPRDARKFSLAADALIHLENNPHIQDTVSFQGKDSVFAVNLPPEDFSDSTGRNAASPGPPEACRAEEGRDERHGE